MIDTRRDLRPIPLSAVTWAPGQCVITLSVGQWDVLLAEAYQAGFILLELDDNEIPLRAYQRAGEVLDARP
jgi:hypothetical protein